MTARPITPTLRACGFCGALEHATGACHILAAMRVEIAAMPQRCNCCRATLTDEARCAACGAHQ